MVRVSEGEDVRRRLRDSVSGEYVLAVNDGWTDPSSADLAKALSWNPAGRYSAYAQGNTVVIWKLCPRPQAQRVSEGGRTMLR